MRYDIVTPECMVDECVCPVLSSNFVAFLWLYYILRHKFDIILLVICYSLGTLSRFVDISQEFEDFNTDLLSSQDQQVR